MLAESLQLHEGKTMGAKSKGAREDTAFVQAGGDGDQTRAGVWRWEDERFRKYPEGRADRMTGCTS